MFFQGALFVAYLYAHLLSRRLGRWHLALLLVPLVFLPPTVGAGTVEAADSLSILTRLVVHVGAPFCALATTAVVAQRWLARRGDEPYALYAVSNAGSLGALLAYAFVVERFVGLETQRWAWAAGFVIYLGLAVLAWRSVAAPPEEPHGADEAPEPRIPFRTLSYWVLLSAAPSAFSMAVTNLLALEAGNVPLVWIVPLAIYLASFVVAFARPRKDDSSRVPLFVRRLWPHVAAVGLFFFSGGDASGGWINAAVPLVVLAFVSLAGHAELHSSRPPPASLTRYYLVIALGGWLGGAFVAVLAPLAFPGLWEYPLAILALAATMGWTRRAQLITWVRSAPWPARAITVALGVAIVLKVVSGASEADSTETLEVRRSFYGVYRVSRTTRGDGAIRDLVSGSTRHGRQREGDTTPLSYYHPAGPLGDVIAETSPPRIGVVGLGVGAAAGYASEERYVRFFEIDPAVVELARAHFTYLERAAGPVEIAIGDARLSLERERAADEPPYDLLLIDAFAGDAIPTHLLTREALELYLARTATDGVLLLHVSNRYYDVRPVLWANAQILGLATAHVARTEDLAPDQDPSFYVALARDESRLTRLVDERGWTHASDAAELAGGLAWTDDHVDPVGALAL